MSAADLWRDALNEEICSDVDGLLDQMAGQAIGVSVDADTVRRLGSALAAGKQLQGTPPITLPELVAIMMTDDTPAVVMAARERIREWFLALRSGPIANRVWRAQDAARQVDSMDAFKQWRDRNLEQQCEFDR